MGFSFIFFSNFIGFDDVVKLLVRKGAEINVVNNYGDTPLTLVAATGNF